MNVKRLVESLTEAAQGFQSKSKGHLGFAAGHEYFKDKAGNVFKAPVGSRVLKGGTRKGQLHANALHMSSGATQLPKFMDAAGKKLARGSASLSTQAFAASHNGGQAHTTETHAAAARLHAKAAQGALNAGHTDLARYHTSIGQIHAQHAAGKVPTAAAKVSQAATSRHSPQAHAQASRVARNVGNMPLARSHAFAAKAGHALGSLVRGIQQSPRKTKLAVRQGIHGVKMGARNLATGFQQGLHAQPLAAGDDTFNGISETENNMDWIYEVYGIDEVSAEKVSTVSALKASQKSGSVWHGNGMDKNKALKLHLSAASKHGQASYVTGKSKLPNSKAWSHYHELAAHAHSLSAHAYQSGSPSTHHAALQAHAAAHEAASDLGAQSGINAHTHHMHQHSYASTPTLTKTEVDAMVAKLSEETSDFEPSTAAHTASKEAGEKNTPECHVIASCKHQLAAKHLRTKADEALKRGDAVEYQRLNKLSRDHEDIGYAHDRISRNKINGESDESRSWLDEVFLPQQRELSEANEGASWAAYHEAAMKAHQSSMAAHGPKATQEDHFNAAEAHHEAAKLAAGLKHKHAAKLHHELAGEHLASWGKVKEEVDSSSFQQLTQPKKFTVQEKCGKKFKKIVKKVKQSGSGANPYAVANAVMSKEELEVEPVVVEA